MSAESSLVHNIALSLTKGVNAEIVRAMADVGIASGKFFEMQPLEFADAIGLSHNHVIQRSHMEDALLRAQQEAEFVKSHNIRAISMLDDDFPKRLTHCFDSPVLIYVLGNADLNPGKAISVVGTRKPTPYGLDFCTTLINDLSELIPSGVTIVSGLAYGVDAAAHTAALDTEMPTLAVLAHGLKMIYPAANRSLAKRILKEDGALVSEYPSTTRPFRGNFLQRNRIVAGLADATIVVESKIKGGAMSTASLAFGYDRDVFALPGRISDPNSAGCNLLINVNKASLTAGASDIAKSMNWTTTVASHSQQPSLFTPEMTDAERLVYESIQQSNSPMPIDRLSVCTSMTMAELLPILFELELNGLIAKSPGNRYTTI